LIVLIANAHHYLGLAKLTHSACRLAGQPNLAIRAQLNVPQCRPEIRLPFTIGSSHDAIDVFDMVLTKVTPSDFEAIS
jgi:hypothetical protein